MADSKFKIHEIQVGITFSIHHFAQLQDDIPWKVETKGLTTTTLTTNDMTRNVQIMVDTIILRFKKMITLTDEKFVWNIVFRLIDLEKANFVHHRGAKKNIDVIHINATTKFKQSKSDIESTRKVKPIAKSILISTLELNIPATLNNAVSPNHTTATVMSFSLHITTDIYLTIYKEENRLDPVILNMSSIFTDIYNGSQANNMFHQVSY